MPQHPTCRLHALLLECNGRGVAVVSSAEGRHRTGDADRGKGHAGKLTRPMGESKILNPWCYLGMRIKQLSGVYSFLHNMVQRGKLLMVSQSYLPFMEWNDAALQV